ncbi:Kinetochore-associated protein 1 [Camelus dromedarius]|uniref:Kinetochore-associated protein 1 n=1 Tax=Camelus dromedarius TaxID=9838 RepID=A0A5N4CA67_CAMDR|nr:Kinetochore-associated protein 1 [Camelus dromedarius]
MLIPVLPQIRNLILNNIIHKKEFGILAKTKYFPVLKSHVMNTSNITELVNYLANELRLSMLKYTYVLLTSVSNSLVHFWSVVLSAIR